MQRLYFLTPSIECNSKIIHALLEAHVERSHIHSIYNRGKSLINSMDNVDLPSMELVPQTEDTLPMGFMSGPLGGMFAMTGPSWPAASGGSQLLGSLGLGMVGLAAQNCHPNPCDIGLNAGQLLLMVDVTQDRCDEIRGLVRRHVQAAEQPELEALNAP